MFLMEYRMTASLGRIHWDSCAEDILGSFNNRLKKSVIGASYKRFERFSFNGNPLILEIPGQGHFGIFKMFVINTERNHHPPCHILRKMVFQSLPGKPPWGPHTIPESFRLRSSSPNTFVSLRFNLSASMGQLTGLPSDFRVTGPLDILFVFRQDQPVRPVHPVHFLQNNPARRCVTA